jgi:hypothetical protein
MIAVAASGTTPFTVACLRSAKERGALTIALANNRNTPLLESAEHPIWLNTGPEAIAGSTRMKAGTAQRTALVLLSSLVMIRLGRIYDGLMVDLQAVNKKLALRSENILSQLTGCTNGAARDALLRAEGSVKLALLLLEGCEVDEARADARPHRRATTRGQGARRGAKAADDPGLTRISHAAPSRRLRGEGRGEGRASTRRSSVGARMKSVLGARNFCGAHKLEKRPLTPALSPQAGRGRWAVAEPSWCENCGLTRRQEARAPLNG